MFESKTIEAFFTALLPSVLGAGLSAATNRHRTFIEHIVAIFTGILVAWYFGGALLEWRDIKPGFIADAIKVGFALFGINFTSAVADNILPAISGLREKYTGKAGEPK